MVRMADKNKKAGDDELEEDTVGAVAEPAEETDEADEWTDGAVEDPDEDF